MSIKISNIILNLTHSKQVHFSVREFFSSPPFSTDEFLVLEIISKL